MEPIASASEAEVLTTELPEKFQNTNLNACRVKSAYILSRSVVSDSATPWMVALQSLLSKLFSRQEYWSGLPFPSPGNLPDPGIESVFPALAGGFFATEPCGKPCWECCSGSSYFQINLIILSLILKLIGVSE